MDLIRFLKTPDASFMLLGPRGTGKSTLIRSALPERLEIDLLQSRNYLRLSSDPSALREMVKNAKPGDWVFIDEIQKVPALLDEVHSLYEEKKLLFALSGSSARKLRREGANLLAGRALALNLFSMTYQEYSKVYDIDQAIAWGSLPRVITEPHYRADYLSSYVETYLREELIEEGLIRKLEPFARFLSVCGTYNSQVLNVENVAREAFLSRSTVENYFQILEETLIGYRLPSLQMKLNSKEVSHPKFYLFDNGVSRACANLTFEEVDQVWNGFAFEALVLNEVRAYNRYLKKNRDLFYYKYSDGYEIDLVIETKRKSISAHRELTAVEIKLAKRFDRRWLDPLVDFKTKAKNKVKKLIVVYRGSEVLDVSGVEILPVEVFFQRLAQNQIL
jgi:predicted AAA+ superfamily ATPase